MGCTVRIRYTVPSTCQMLHFVQHDMPRHACFIGRSATTRQSLTPHRRGTCESRWCRSKKVHGKTDHSVAGSEKCEIHGLPARHLSEPQRSLSERAGAP